MKKPLLYPKLAWQGIRKNAETYLPYLLMGILMVGVSYIMNYLTRPALMGALSMGGTTLMVLQMGKIVISVFSVIFLYYCNSFLIRRRMKEFGLYNILGMGKGNIARVMLWGFCFFGIDHINIVVFHYTSWIAFHFISIKDQNQSHFFIPLIIT